MILFLLLIIPLAASPLTFFLRRRSAMEMVNLVAFAVLLCLAATLGIQVLRSGSVSLWNGFFCADALSALVVLLTSFVAFVCSIYAVGYFRHDETHGIFQERKEDLRAPLAVPRLREYYSLTPLFVFSMVLVALANNLGILWVAIDRVYLGADLGLRATYRDGEQLRPIRRLAANSGHGSPWKDSRRSGTWERWITGRAGRERFWNEYDCL